MKGGYHVTSLLLVTKEIRKRTKPISCLNSIELSAHWQRPPPHPTANSPNFMLIRLTKKPLSCLLVGATFVECPPVSQRDIERTLFLPTIFHFCSLICRYLPLLWRRGSVLDLALTGQFIRDEPGEAVLANWTVHEKTTCRGATWTVKIWARMISCFYEGHEILSSDVNFLIIKRNR